MGKMNLNTCTARLLSNLPGITQFLAKNICDFRRTRPTQCFTHIDQLWRVSGMSRTSFRILDRYVEIRQQKTPCVGEILFADSKAQLGLRGRSHSQPQQERKAVIKAEFSRTPSPRKMRIASPDSNPTMVIRGRSPVRKVPPGKPKKSSLPPIAQGLTRAENNVPDNLEVSQSGNRITLQYRFENDRVSIPQTVVIRTRPLQKDQNQAKKLKPKSSLQRVREERCAPPPVREAWAVPDSVRLPRQAPEAVRPRSPRHITHKRKVEKNEKVELLEQFEEMSVSQKTTSVSQIQGPAELSVENVSLHELSTSSSQGRASVEKWLQSVHSNEDQSFRSNPDRQKNGPTPSGSRVRSRARDEFLRSAESSGIRPGSRGQKRLRLNDTTYSAHCRHSRERRGCGDGSVRDKRVSGGRKHRTHPRNPQQRRPRTAPDTGQDFMDDYCQIM